MVNGVDSRLFLLDNPNEDLSGDFSRAIAVRAFMCASPLQVEARAWKTIQVDDLTELPCSEGWSQVAGSGCVVAWQACHAEAQADPTSATGRALEVERI